MLVLISSQKIFADNDLNEVVRVGSVIIYSEKFQKSIKASGVSHLRELRQKELSLQFNDSYKDVRCVADEQWGVEFRIWCSGIPVQ